MTRGHLALAATAAVLMSRSLVPDARAEPVRVDFEIQVRHTLGNLSDLFGAPIALDDVVHGTLTYDPAAPDRSPSPLEGHYRPSGMIRFNTASPLALPVSGIWVFDQTFDPRPGFDDVFAVLASHEAFPGFDAMFSELSFRGEGRVGDALPRSTAELLAAFGAGGGIRFLAWQTDGEPRFDSGTHELIGTVRLLADAPQPVPEPGTLLLFMTGGAALVRHLRRSKLAG